MKAILLLLITTFCNLVYAASPPTLVTDVTRANYTEQELQSFQDAALDIDMACNRVGRSLNENISCSEYDELRNIFNDFVPDNTSTLAEQEMQRRDYDMTLARYSCIVNNNSGVSGLGCDQVSSYIGSKKYGQGDVMVLERVERIFMNIASGWGDTMTGYAKNLFLILASICIVKQFGFLALKRADIGEFFAELIKFIVTLGFFWWLLSNGPEFAKAIIDSLKQMAESAAAAVRL